MDHSLLNKLLLARRLYELARENLSGVNDISLSIGVNLLQDAVEAFLLAVAQHVDAPVGQKMDFDKYFVAIKEKTGQDLPFRLRLLELNRLRVSSKHYGIPPPKPPLENLVVTVREFFEEVCTSTLRIAFATLSLIDLVNEGEAKELLRAAQKAFVEKDFSGCLISCRKAIFVRIEWRYDVRSFREEGGMPPIFFSNKSPFFARSRDYIDRHVKDPIDFIVLDYNQLELDLVKSGMDSVSFWNVCRLTPAVYRLGEDEWVVKNELDILAQDGIESRAEYVLDTTVNLFVTADQKEASTRSPGWRMYYIGLKREQVPVYEKADINSRVAATTPQGLTQIDVNFSITGLDGTTLFWHVLHTPPDDLSGAIWGYVLDDDVEPT